MKIILFGATGMVGQGVLRECLLDPEVEAVLSVGRNATGQQHAKLREIAHADLFDLSAIEKDLRGYEACFFCLGVSSAGMSAAAYRRVTYDLTLAVAGVLARINRAMIFIYVSGMGTDSSKRGWSAVKGETEDALRRLPFRATYMFRPALIVPLHGIQSKTPLYRIFYTVFGPLLPLFYSAAPKFVTTTEQVGKAMIAAARRGGPSAILENSDINKM